MHSGFISNVKSDLKSKTSSGGYTDACMNQVSSRNQEIVSFLHNLHCLYRVFHIFCIRRHLCYWIFEGFNRLRYTVLQILIQSYRFHLPSLLMYTILYIQCYKMTKPSAVGLRQNVPSNYRSFHAVGHHLLTYVYSKLGWFQSVTEINLVLVLWDLVILFLVNFSDRREKPESQGSVAKFHNVFPVYFILF